MKCIKKLWWRLCVMVCGMLLLWQPIAVQAQTEQLLIRVSNVEEENSDVVCVTVSAAMPYLSASNFYLKFDPGVLYYCGMTDSQIPMITEEEPGLMVRTNAGEIEQVRQDGTIGLVIYSPEWKQTNRFENGRELFSLKFKVKGSSGNAAIQISNGNDYRKSAANRGVTIVPLVYEGGEILWQFDDGLSMILPGQIVRLEEQAFIGCAYFQTVRFDGETIKSIGAEAFKDCSALEKVYLPSSVEEIGKDAFAGCPLLVIYCQEGSYAHTYAIENGIACIVQE